VCEYNVNLSTNEKVITEKQNLKNNVEYQGHLKVKVIMLVCEKGHDRINEVYEYEVHRLTNEKVMRRNFNANC